MLLLELRKNCRHFIRVTVCRLARVPGKCQRFTGKWFIFQKMNYIRALILSSMFGKIISVLSAAVLLTSVSAYCGPVSDVLPRPAELRFGQGYLKMDAGDILSSARVRQSIVRAEPESYVLEVSGDSVWPVCRLRSRRQLMALDPFFRPSIVCGFRASLSGTAPDLPGEAICRMCRGIFSISAF